MLDRLARELDRPGAEYRAKPFWAWNGRLDPAELRRQIRVMKRMGMGGFFMHSRVGLATPYLGEDWFRCVEACIDEARRQGMEAWFYDEDRWPSGAAGGLVTKNPAYRARAVVAHPHAAGEPVAWTDDTLAVAVLERVDLSTVRRVRAAARGEAAVAGPGEQAVAFRVAVEGGDPWYNGQAYLDTLNAEAVRAFIRVTHEAYRARVGDAFGGAAPGIFTDEPHRGRCLQRPPQTVGDAIASLPYTGDLPARYAALAGDADAERFARDLPALFFDVEGVDAAPARWRYHEALTQLFVGAFARPIGAWCAAHGLLFTGHALDEDTLSGQTFVTGSPMRFYEPMQAPGIDLLTERWRLTETYGCTGWDFPFAGHKALGDWQAALGINLRCPHLSWYTMLGEAKRDYPASIFRQSPWWTLYPKVEDYFARVNAFAARGREVRDLLVVHPVESMWTLTRAGWLGSDAVRALDESLPRVRDALLAANLDFDYGDEEMLSRLAAVDAPGAGAPVLRVGEAAYTAVLVPPLLTMRRSTLDLLGRFRAAGGLVVFAGDPPARVDAVPDGAARRFAGAGPRVPDRDPAALAAALGAARRVSVRDDAGREIEPVLHLLREDDDAFYLFLCNVGHAFGPGETRNEPPVRDRALAYPSATAVAAPQAAGTPVEYDLDAGGFVAADAARGADGWIVKTSFPRLGSRLFVFPKYTQAPAPGVVAPRPARTEETRRVPVDPDAWAYALDEPNVLVLDRPRWRVDAGRDAAGGAWRGADEILQVDNAVRDALGRPRRGGRMAQPWVRETTPPDPAWKAGRVTLSYPFDADPGAVGSGGLWVALEAPDRCAARLNGVLLPADADAGWWVDPSLRRLPAPAEAIRPGANELRVEVDYRLDHPGLEAVYLLGAFGVRLDGARARLAAAPAALALGDWTGQGLPFYSGHVAYRARIAPAYDPASERVVLALGAWRGTAVRVWIDGREAGVIGWPPDEIDLTGRLAPGEPAELSIEVIGHRRNSHGPLHLKDKHPAWTGSGEFLRGGPDDPRWSDDYQLVECGLLEAPALSIRRVRDDG